MKLKVKPETEQLGVQGNATDILETSEVLPLCKLYDAYGVWHSWLCQSAVRLKFFLKNV